MLDDHETCYKEMRRIDSEWADRYYKSMVVARVIQKISDRTERVLIVTDIYRDPEFGLTIYVR